MLSGHWPAGCCPRRMRGHVKTLFDDIQSLPVTTAVKLLEQTGIFRSVSVGISRFLPYLKKVEIESIEVK
jgi:hypothetical protein